MSEIYEVRCMARRTENMDEGMSLGRFKKLEAAKAAVYKNYEPGHVSLLVIRDGRIVERWNY